MRVNFNRPNKEQKKLLREQCVIEFDKLLGNLDHDVFIQILHFFHFERGYGQKRLENLANDLAHALDGIHARYELSDNDTAWICEKKLREDHIDVDKLIER